MLTITKLGIEVLSRFAKKITNEQNVLCPCIYRGNYSPSGVPYEHAVVMTSETILSKGHWCNDCFLQVEYQVYGWSWRDGLVKHSFTQKTTFGEAVTELSESMPSLSHIAVMEKHKERNILWVYRYGNGE